MDLGAVNQPLLEEGEPPVREPSPPQLLDNLAFLPNLSCHVVWLGGNEVVPELPFTTQEEKQTFLESQITATVQWIEESSGYVVARSRAFNQQCMAAAYLAHLSNFEDALTRMMVAHEYLQIEEFQRQLLPKHLQAYEYLVQANKYCINEMKRNFEALQRLQNRIPPEDDLQVIIYDENDNAFQAVMAVAKGIFAVELRSRERQIRFFVEATRIDPDFSEWHLMLFRAKRAERRELRVGDSWNIPNKEEEEAIETAFRLDPTCCLCQASKAEMLDDKYRLEPDSVEKRNAADEIIRLFNAALEGFRVKMWVRIRLAEMHGYGFYPHLDQREGERLFALCEREYPNSSRVLHKFGRFYVKTNNIERAYHYFVRGLDCDGTNYQCLIDCLKSLGRRFKSDYQRKHMKMLSVIKEKCVPHKMLYPTKMFVELMMMQGVLLWMVSENDRIKKMEACECWIEACVKTSDAFTTIVETVNRGYFYPVGKFYIRVNEIIPILGEISTDVVSAERRNAVESLMERFRLIGTPY